MNSPSKDQAQRDARAQLNAAIRRGVVLRPDACQRCGEVPKRGCDGRTTIHGHHHDYSRPLDVEWLCAHCHHKAETPICSDALQVAARMEASARAERRAATTTDPRDDNRQPGRLLLVIHGRSIDIELRPDPRDVRIWRAYRDGQPWMRSGLERIWRALQSEIPPCIGRRHWGG